MFSKSSVLAVLGLATAVLSLPIDTAGGSAKVAGVRRQQYSPPFCDRFVPGEGPPVCNGAGFGPFAGNPQAFCNQFLPGQGPPVCNGAGFGPFAGNSQAFCNQFLPGQGPPFCNGGFPNAFCDRFVPGAGPPACNNGGPGAPSGPNGPPGGVPRESSLPDDGFYPEQN